MAVFLSSGLSIKNGTQINACRFFARSHCLSLWDDGNVPYMVPVPDVDGVLSGAVAGASGVGAGTGAGVEEGAGADWVGVLSEGVAAWSSSWPHAARLAAKMAAMITVLFMATLQCRWLCALVKGLRIQTNPNRRLLSVCKWKRKYPIRNNVF